MKKLLATTPILLAVAVATSSCGGGSDSTSVLPAGQQALDQATAPTDTSLVRVAVIQSGAVERVRTLFTNAGMRVTIAKVPDREAYQHFPSGSYKVLVPQPAKTQAWALIQQDSRKGKYWIQSGPWLDTQTNAQPDSVAATPPSSTKP